MRDGNVPVGYSNTVIGYSNISTCKHDIPNILGKSARRKVEISGCNLCFPNSERNIASKICETGVFSLSFFIHYCQIVIYDSNVAIRDRNIAIRDRNVAFADRNIAVADGNVAITDWNVAVAHGNIRLYFECFDATAPLSKPYFCNLAFDLRQVIYFFHTSSPVLFLPEGTEPAHIVVRTDFEARKSFT